MEGISTQRTPPRETALFIADRQGVEVSIDEGINEVDCGSWMGKSFSELLESEEGKGYNKRRSTSRAPEGEFVMEVQTRAWGALERILAQYRDVKDATAAVVSHGDVIRALLVLLLGMPVDYIH